MIKLAGFLAVLILITSCAPQNDFGRSRILSVEKQRILSVLNASDTQQLIVGQNIEGGGNPTTGYAKLKPIERIRNSTGKYPSIIETDYYIQDGRPINYTVPNEAMIKYYRDGGLVMLSLSIRNWRMNTSFRDRTLLDGKKMVDNTTVDNKLFRQELDRIAKGLQQLEDSNVIVILRPYHEMNGGWFWWGNRDFAEYKALWIYTYNYLTINKGLSNILWMYSPNDSPATRNGLNAYLGYYPGNEYVDLIGIDRYSFELLPVAYAYKDLATLNKPLGYAELGAYSANNPVVTYYAANKFSDTMRTKYPEMDFLVHYCCRWGLEYLSNTTAYMNSEVIITRDELWR